MQSMDAYQSRDYQLALSAIDKAILLNKDMAKFYQLKGDIYRAQFNAAQSIAAYEMALKKRSNFIEVQEAIGDVYLDQKNYDEAIRAYKKVTVLNPERTDMLLKIAECYLQHNELDVAQYHLNIYEKTALQYRQPFSDKYYEIRADALYQQEAYESSISTLNNIKSPERRALHLYGLNYYARGDYEQGVGFFNKLLNLDKERGEWFYYRGIYFYQKHDLGDAKNQFLLAQKLDSTLTEVSYYMGKIYLLENERAAALEQFETYKMSGVNPLYLQEVGEILLPQQSE
jgi:tetratricopeptide (TPR) repeat protein